MADRQQSEPSAATRESGENPLLDLPSDKQEELIAAWEDYNSQNDTTNVRRRGVLQAGAALLTGTAIGGGAYALSSEEVAAAANEVGQIGEPGNLVDVYGEDVSAVSVDTVELDIDSGGVRFVKPGTSVSDINSLVGTAGRTIALLPGNHFLSDRIEITAADVTVLVLPGAHLKIADSATPTTISASNSSTHTPVIYSDGHNNVSVVNRGHIDGNDSNHSIPECIFIQNADNVTVDGLGGRFSDHNTAVVCIDDTDIRIEDIEADSQYISGAAVWMEGCSRATIENIHCDTGESVDLNYANQNITIRGVSASNSVEVLDINGSKNITAHGIRAGTSTGTLLQIAGAGTALFSSASATGLGEIAIHGVEGITSDEAIKIVNNETFLGEVAVTGINVESTGANAVEVAPSAADVFEEQLRLAGYAKSSGTGTTAWALNLNGGNQQHGLRLDIVGVATDSHGVIIGDWDDVVGTTVAQDCADEGVQIFTSSGKSVSHFDLWVVAHDNSGNNIQVGSGNGTVGPGTLRGREWNATTTGVAIGTAQDIRVEMDYESRSDSGTRTVWNGLGTNSGDPSSTGDWNGNGFEGVVVRDTTNNNTYIFNDGGWSQIASA